MNGEGRFGDGTTHESVVPIQVGTDTWTQVSSGGYSGGFMCAIRSDGSLSCWGSNGPGTVGDGTTTARVTPYPTGGASNWTSVSAGGNHACAIRVDDTLWRWGCAIGSDDTMWCWGLGT